MIKIPGDILILHMCTKNYNHMMHGAWGTEWDRQNFQHFGVFFVLLPPPNDPENQNFLKMKKMDGYIILLHMCTINEDHMIYDFRNIRCNRQNLLSFWAIFCPCPFTLLTTQKINSFKKWNAWRYYHFTRVP